MATNPFAKPKASRSAGGGGSRASGGGKPVKIAGSRNMTNAQVRAAGTAGFSFKGSGRSAAYRAAAGAALKNGATAAQAHRAASAADSAAYAGKQ